MRDLSLRNVELNYSVWLAIFIHWAVASLVQLVYGSGKHEYPAWEAFRV